MGMALTSCTVPAAGKPTFELGEGEMEMGIGIHGEPGRERMPLLPAAELTARMAGSVLADLPFRGGDEVIAMVNGMGGTPLMELYLVYAELERILQGLGIRVARRLVGNYITSLEMAGCSITLLKADDETAVAVGRSGAHSGPAMGDLSEWPWAQPEVLKWLEVLQQVYAENRQLAHGTGLGYRRRRPRHQHGPRLHRGESGAGGPSSVRYPFRFQSVATVLIRHVGGAAGPLYGTFFLRAAAACAGKTEIEAADRGGAVPGGHRGCPAAW